MGELRAVLPIRPRIAAIVSLTRVGFVKELSSVCRNLSGRAFWNFRRTKKVAFWPGQNATLISNYFRTRVDDRLPGERVFAFYAPTLVVLASGAVRRASVARPKYNR